jgi:hypothetical protein
MLHQVQGVILREVNWAKGSANLLEEEVSDHHDILPDQKDKGNKNRRLRRRMSYHMEVGVVKLIHRQVHNFQEVRRKGRCKLNVIFLSD